MKKRIISILLAVIMVFSLVPMTAFAIPETVTYPVWVSGVQVTESNKANVLGDSSVAFDSEKGILTLNNATVSTTGSASGFNYGDGCVCAVKSELDKLTVNLVGNSQIGKEVDSESSLEDYSIDLGFSCSGDIVFTGDADSSLTVYDYGAGIRAKNVTFGEDFKGKLTIRDCGGPEPQPPCAINAFGVRDELTWEYVSDGTVSILGGTFDIESFQSNGIEVDGNITIKNAIVTSVGDYDAIHSEYGDITINDSEITAVGDTAINSYDGDVLIENTNLKITSTGCEGISADDITLIGCGKVEINSGEDSIYSGGKVSIINCPDVVLECNELTGIYGYDILIDGSTIDVNAPDGTGIRAAHNEENTGDGSITVKKSTIDVHAKRNGIDCNSLSVVGGTNIYSVGDIDSDGKGCGAYINGDESAISVSGSTVKLTGGEAAIKLEKSSETNPYTGTLPNVSFKGNTAYDTFTSMEDINYKSQKRADIVDEYFEIAYVGDALAKSVSVIHVHNLVKVGGQAATEQAAGWKDHYECKDSADACGTLFEDENGTTPIEDLTAWKAEGGNGYLPKLVKPVILIGADSKWTKGTENGVMITVSSPYEKFSAAYLDGNLIPESGFNKFPAAIAVDSTEALQNNVYIKGSHIIIDNTPEIEPGDELKGAIAGVAITQQDTHGDRGKQLAIILDDQSLVFGFAKLDDALQSNINPVVVATGAGAIALGFPVVTNGAPAGDVKIRIRGIGTINGDISPILGFEKPDTRVKFVYLLEIEPDSIQDKTILKEVFKPVAMATEGFEIQKVTENAGSTVMPDNESEVKVAEISALTGIELKPEYLETLAVGSHTLKFVYTDGTEVSTTIEIAEQEVTPISPETGAVSNMDLWITLMLVSSIGLCACPVLGKKRKNEQ